jgi:hypothetical protein
VFKLLWSAIKRVLSPRTAEKVVFLGGDYKEKLLLYFDPDQIPQVIKPTAFLFCLPHHSRVHPPHAATRLPTLTQSMGGKDAFDCAAWCSAELGPPTGPIWPEKKGWFSGGSMLQSRRGCARD